MSFPTQADLFHRNDSINVWSIERSYILGILYHFLVVLAFSRHPFKKILYKWAELFISMLHYDSQKLFAYNPISAHSAPLALHPSPTARQYILYTSQKLKNVRTKKKVLGATIMSSRSSCCTTAIIPSLSELVKRTFLYFNFFIYYLISWSVLSFNVQLLHLSYRREF